jgi:hypothetical protein
MESAFYLRVKIFIVIINLFNLSSIYNFWGYLPVKTGLSWYSLSNLYL